MYINKLGCDAYFNKVLSVCFHVSPRSKILVVSAFNFFLRWEFVIKLRLLKGIFFFSRLTIFWAQRLESKGGPHTGL